MTNVTKVSLGIATAAFLSIATAAWAHGKASAKAVTYTGCLAKGDKANEFRLTNVNGGSDEYELLGGGRGMKNHVGHKVEIKGKETSAQAAAKAEKEGAAEEAGHKHLRVSSMKHLAETCP